MDTFYYTTIEDAIKAAKEKQEERKSFQLTCTPVFAYENGDIAWKYRLDTQSLGYGND